MCQPFSRPTRSSGQTSATCKGCQSLGNWDEPLESSQPLSIGAKELLGCHDIALSSIIPSLCHQLNVSEAGKKIFLNCWQFWETCLVRSDFATFWTLHQWPQNIRKHSNRVAMAGRFWSFTINLLYPWLSQHAYIINIIKGFWTLESITGEWNSYHRNFLWNFPGTGTLSPGTTSSSLSSRGTKKGVKGGIWHCFLCGRETENSWKCLKFEINSCGQILSFSVFVGSLCLPFRFFKHVTRPECLNSPGPRTIQAISLQAKCTKSRSFSRPILETCFANHRTELPVYSGVFHSPFHSFVPFRHWLVSNFDQIKAVFPTASSSRKVSGSRRSRSGCLVSPCWPTQTPTLQVFRALGWPQKCHWPEISWFTEHFWLQLLCGVSSWCLGVLYLRFLIDWFLTIFAKPKA